MITRLYTRTIADFNGAMLQLTTLDPAAIRIPGTNYYLGEYATMGEIAKAADHYDACDFALPQSFYNDYMKRHGEPPRGVWSYQKNRTFGEFVSLHQLLTIIGQKINALEAQETA